MDTIYTGSMQRTFPRPTAIVEPRAPLGAPECLTCGRRFLPETIPNGRPARFCRRCAAHMSMRIALAMAHATCEEASHAQLA